MRRLVGLVLTSFGVFLAIPIAIAFTLVLAGLALVAAVMLFWSVVSFLGWIFLSEPAAGRAALISFGVGGGALAIIVIAIDAVTGGWSRRKKQSQVKHQAKADVPFLELRTNEAA